MAHGSRYSNFRRFGREIQSKTVKENENLGGRDQRQQQGLALLLDHRILLNYKYQEKGSSRSLIVYTLQQHTHPSMAYYQVLL